MLFGPKLKYFKIEDLDYEKRYSRIFPIRPNRVTNNSLFAKKHDFQCSSSPVTFKRMSSPCGYSRNSEVLQKMLGISKNKETYALANQWSPIINSLNTSTVRTHIMLAATISYCPNEGSESKLLFK